MKFKQKITSLEAKIKEHELESKQWKLQLKDEYKPLVVPDFYVNMGSAQNQKVTSLSKLPKIRFIKGLIIDEVPDRSDELNSLLKDYTCDKVKYFSFNNYATNEVYNNLVQMSNYINTVKYVCTKTLREIFLNEMIIDSDQLSILVKSSRECEELIINS